jgi:hypothetical protein
MGSDGWVGEMRLRVKIYPPGKGLGDGRHLLATLSSFSLLGLQNSPDPTGMKKEVHVFVPHRKNYLEI